MTSRSTDRMIINVGISQLRAMQSEGGSFGKYQAARQQFVNVEKQLLNQIAARKPGAMDKLDALRKSQFSFPATSTGGSARVFVFYSAPSYPTALLGQINFETRQPGFNADGNFTLHPYAQGQDFHSVDWHRSGNRVMNGLQSNFLDQPIRKPKVLMGRSGVSQHRMPHERKYSPN